MAADSLDKPNIEKYLNSTIKSVIEKHKTATTSVISSKLVEIINSQLPDKCPSVENFKYIVHAIVQEQWGQGSLVGGKCVWDQTQDMVIHVNQETEKFNVSLQVFFVYINDDDGDNDSEDDS